MATSLTISPLAEHLQAVPELATWFKTEWPHWYGPGGPGDAESDLLAYANHGSLPLGVIAFLDDKLCGVAALKAQSLPSQPHLSPWAAAGFVVPSLRGRGVGAALLCALEREAASLGFTRMYCGTGTAASLLVRSGWAFIEMTVREGQEIAIYEKTL